MSITDIVITESGNIVKWEPYRPNGLVQEWLHSSFNSIFITENAPTNEKTRIIKASSLGHKYTATLLVAGEKDAIKPIIIIIDCRCNQQRWVEGISQTTTPSPIAGIEQEQKVIAYAFNQVELIAEWPCVGMGCRAYHMFTMEN